MIRYFLPILIALTANAHAQLRTVSCRLVSFEKASGFPEQLYTIGATEGEFLKHNLSLSVDVTPVNLAIPASGKLDFLAEGKAGSTVIASTTLPKNINKAYLFFLPTASGDTKSYKIIPLEESEKSTPAGGAYICNIASKPVRVALGEYKYQLLPGKSVSIQQPTKIDKYNMAQLAIQIEGENGWTTIKDTMTRFSKRDRYYIFTFVDPRFNRPTAKLYQQSVPIATVQRDSGAAAAP